MSMAEQKTTESDGALVRRSLDGDTAAFELLVTRHFGVVYAVAFARLRQREPAEELAQEAFLAAYLNLAKLRNPDRFAPWVCRIARHNALKWIRSGTRHSRALERVAREQISGDTHTTSPADTIQSKQEAEMLDDAIGKLSDDQREAVLLHYGEELPKNEVARRMGVHPSTVGRLLERSLRVLRGELESHLREQSKSLAPRRAAIENTTKVIAAVSVMSSAAKASVAADLAATGAAVGSAIIGVKGAIAVAAVVTALVAAGLWGPSLVQWGYVQMLPDTVQDDIRKNQTVPLHFPAEWAALSQVTPEMSAQLKQIDAQWQAVASVQPLLTRLDDYSLLQPPADVMTTQALVTAQTAPVLDALAAVVENPDYRMTDTLPLASYQSLARAAVVRAAVEARAGNWPLAMQMARMPLKMARRDPSAPLMIHSIAQGLISKSAKALAELTPHCPDENLLANILNEINGDYNMVALGILHQAELIDVLTLLRTYAAAGISIDMSPGQPLTYYRSQARQKRPDYIRHQLSTMTPGTSKYDELERHLESAEKSRDSILGDTDMWIVKINFEEMATREQVATTYLDLARLSIAQTILKLRDAPPVTNAGALVPDFFDSAPIDPFLNTPYRLDPATGHFYSVGPDKIDESRAAIYDATNGTLSPGDIRFP